VSVETRKPRAGFVGFGEVNSPRELIERKCRAAHTALSALGIDIVATQPVADDPGGAQETRARRELAGSDWDILVVCVAGWIPSHTVIDVISPFRHRPMVLWGLTGEMEDGRLVTTADQAGTAALRAPMEGLGFRFTYFYDTPDAPYGAAAAVAQACGVARAAALLREARVGMVGYRDMKLHSTLVDGLSLRRVVGPEIEVVDTLEIAQLMEQAPAAEIAAVEVDVRAAWRFDKEPSSELLAHPIRLYLAVMEKVRERGYGAISLIDVDGIKKLMGFPPAGAMMLLADRGGVATIPENDGLGAVTQLMVRALTGQVAAYFEFYEFMTDRVLCGVPDYVPAEVVDGDVQVKLAKFGELSEGVLNVSRVRTGRVTLCRLGSVGDRYRMHVAVGEAFTPKPWEEAGWERPAPQLPSLEVVLDSPVREFTSKVLGQHYILSYGDQREPLAALCRLLGVDVV
jgi:L-fucose isomerase-like protein